MQGWAKISALGLIALLVAAPAFAGTVSYDDQSTFLSSLSSSTTVNFDGDATGLVVAGDGTSTAMLNGITFSAHVNLTSGHGNLNVVDANVTGFGTTSETKSIGSDDAADGGALFATDNITMKLGSPVTAFGLYVVGGFNPGSFTLDIGSGVAHDTSTVFTIPNDGMIFGGTASYIGITSTTPFQTITIGATVPGTDPNNGPLWNIDDVSYGTAKTNTPPPMPEPSSLVLLGTGLLAVVRRLKRA